MTDVPRGRRIHLAWWAAGAGFLVSLGAAGFRSPAGVMVEPLHSEFDGSVDAISLATGINLMLFGLTAPFAALSGVPGRDVLPTRIRARGCRGDGCPARMTRSSRSLGAT